MTNFLFAVLTMILWGIAPVFGKLGLGKLEPYTALTLRSLTISLILLIYGAAAGKVGALGRMDPASGGLIILEGILGSLVGHLMYFYALKYGETSRMVPITAAFPIVTFFVGILFLGEKFSWDKLLGAVLIITGILIIKR